MGVYSKRFLEESVKKKRIVDESVLDDIDVNVEKVLSNLRREYPGNAQVILDASNLILHKISENYDDFVNDKGTINIDSFSKFVTNVVKKQTEKEQENNQKITNGNSNENLKQFEEKDSLRGKKDSQKSLGEQERENSIDNARKAWGKMSKEEKRAFEKDSREMLDKKTEEIPLFQDDKNELIENVSQGKDTTEVINLSKLKGKFFIGSITEEEYKILKDSLQTLYKEGKLKEDKNGASLSILKAIEKSDSIADARLEFFEKCPEALETFIKRIGEESKNSAEFWQKISGTGVETVVDRYFSEDEDVRDASKDIKYQKLKSLILIDKIETIRTSYSKLREKEGFDFNGLLKKFGLEEASDIDLSNLSNLGIEESDDFFNFWVARVKNKFEAIKSVGKNFELNRKEETNQFDIYFDFYEVYNSYMRTSEKVYNDEDISVDMQEEGEGFIDIRNKFSLADCIGNDEILYISQFEDKLKIKSNQNMYKENDFIAKIDKSITGPTSLEKAMAKPKEMVLDYLEMEIKSGADPQNEALVMADMLRDKKLLTKFKGASETGLSIEEYAEIMSGVVMETQKMIDEGKLPETITENGVDRQTSIDDFINMTFDDTEILLSNLPERISDLSREEIAQLIAEKVKESTREQEVEMAENAAILEEVENEVRNSENLNIQENSSQEQEPINQAEQDELAARLQKEQVAEEQAQQEPTVQEPVVQEEVAPKETALVADKDRTLMQKASAGIRNFFKAAKEKVGDFFESMKEKFGGKSDDKFGSEVFAMDATKKNEQKKKEEDQWQTIDGKENLSAAQEEAKRKTEKEPEKEPVSVGERDE